MTVFINVCLTLTTIIITTVIIIVWTYMDIRQWPDRVKSSPSTVWVPGTGLRLYKSVFTEHPSDGH